MTKLHRNTILSSLMKLINTLLVLFTLALTSLARADQYFDLNYFSADGTLNVSAVLDVSSTDSLCGYNGANLGYNTFTNTSTNIGGFAILGITGTRAVNGVAESITGLYSPSNFGTYYWFDNALIPVNGGGSNTFTNYGLAYTDSAGGVDNLFSLAALGGQLVDIGTLQGYPNEVRVSEYLTPTDGPVNSVPDGGSTVLFLGAGLIGMVAVGRKFTF